MITKRITAFLVIICSIITITACDEEYAWVEPQAQSYSYSSLNDLMDRTYAPDGRGYLAVNSEGKKLLHLEGAPYEMGYQHGYLCAEAVSRMASVEFWGGLIIQMTGIDVTVDQLYDLVGGEAGVRTLVNLLYLPIDKAIRAGDVPKEFLEEINGIVDGANDAGFAVEFKSVMMNNMAFDAILGIGYPVVSPFIPLAIPFLPVPHACNAFVASGSATLDGRTLMGRDFMFANGAYYKYGLLIEYVPDNGNRLVSVMAPSFVGTAAGMNEKGIGIGIDMVPSANSNVTALGMGGLLINRYVLQYANELGQAAKILTTKKLGVSWLFPIGDGIGAEKGGAVVEVSANLKRVRFDEYVQPSWASLFGIPKQIEKKGDLVVATNHYLNPDMYLALGGAIPDSTWRYETMLDLILKAYGTMDNLAARVIIDFLHPPNYGYYAPDQASVESSISMFDLSNLEVSSLYGLYSDPWVLYKF
ncbi:MAG: hypothetical protein JW807_08980 [Spirochaetes bacterium]|nr:hypothetical protein [Spirochaetota bacterium]